MIKTPKLWKKVEITSGHTIIFQKKLQKQSYVAREGGGQRDSTWLATAAEHYAQESYKIWTFGKTQILNLANSTVMDKSCFTSLLVKLLKNL